MSQLSPSFLGKKVILDDSYEYIIRYEEESGKKRKNVLLFDQDVPVIFGVINDDGKFLDSYYVSNKTTRAATEALEKYKKIQDRKKQYRVTQDDLRDALKPLGEAKMKNENILKHLTDEHLEDIKNLWPSRLLTLQNSEGKSKNSLILTALEEAIQLANGVKSLKFLVQHRYDSYIPKLGKHYENYPQMLDDVTKYYLNYDHKDIVIQFLYEAAKYVPVNDHDLVQKLLNEARKIDHIYSTSTLRQLLSMLFKRAKSETGSSPKNWLNEMIRDKALRRSIVETIKKKTG